MPLIVYYVFLATLRDTVMTTAIFFVTVNTYTCKLARQLWEIDWFVRHLTACLAYKRTV